MKHEIFTSRSYKYQWLLKESTYSDDAWKTISLLQPNPITETITSWTREDLLTYEQELERLFWFHVDAHLSKRQAALLELLKRAIQQGEGQQWIADEMGVNQSSIAKALKGNSFYTGGVVKRYGGIASKLSKLIAQDPKIQTIIQTMSDLGAEDLSPRLLPHWACFRKLSGKNAKALKIA